MMITIVFNSLTFQTGMNFLTNFDEEKIMILSLLYHTNQVFRQFISCCLRPRAGWKTDATISQRVQNGSVG